MKYKLLSFSIILVLVLVTFIPTVQVTSTLTAQEKYDELPTLDSLDNLKGILANVENQRGFMYFGGVAETADGSLMKTAAGATDLNLSSQENSYSSTNAQVNGVDEADVVKTDGKYIYQINNGKIIITQAYPANELKVINTLEFKQDEFMPNEIYVDDKHLVVIGSSFTKTQLKEKENITLKIAPMIMPLNSLKVLVYNIEDKANIQSIREVEMEGQYITSRKIGSSIYLVANKYLDIYRILNDNVDPVMPMYRDSLKNNEGFTLDYKDIKYFPGSPESNFLMIGSFNIENEQDFNVTAYLGAGQNIYASLDHLYVTITTYENQEDNIATNDFADNLMLPINNYSERKSNIFKFKLDDGLTTFMYQGEVPGSVLNQFSMDEHNGYFRIATTTGDMWRNDEYTSKNNLYILDSKLNISGKIEDIAPGERIYSVRFMGNKGYMVTFKNVDPLFVIDLTNPTNPTILGKLKIPGYSDYLHPYDENHLIGFGKETIVLDNKHGSGEMAYYQGMKISMFDVSDVNNPKEMFVEIIGDRGTYSELLYNHKALLFSKEKNLLAFPVTVMEVKNKNDPLAYGEFSFQGAYIYNVDLKDGFTLKKTITHLSNDDYNKSGYGWYESGKNVERIMYINEALYTISKGMIKANNLTTLDEIDSIEIK